MPDQIGITYGEHLLKTNQNNIPEVPVLLQNVFRRALINILMAKNLGVVN